MWTLGLNDLAVAILFNGIVDFESAFVRRPAIISSIYRDLGLAATSTSPASDRDQQPAGGRRRRWRRRDRH